MAKSGNPVCSEHPLDTELADALAALDSIYAAVGVHRHHPVSVLLVNLENQKKFAELLHAAEREFFMVPGEVDDDYPDEEPDDVCLVNCWGSSQEQYLADFRESLVTVAARELRPAARDVLVERRRQVESEGMSAEGDDRYHAAELPRAAAAYILSGANDEAPAIWPWPDLAWKPRDARSNYVRAAALILAEIERIDRAAAVGQCK